MNAGESSIPPPDGPPAMLDSAALLGDAREVLIRHGAETYCLKLTRHDKLILTK
ncbi:hemin uptake protein HemP [Roseomonas sp. CAU 1739]|uniref:hemin uptake protein HemP n=1 Tax=Roseomonas sp. CAU 1739 TaxID=3140364 RepID=UPI00325AABEB